MFATKDFARTGDDRSCSREPALVIWNLPSCFAWAACLNTASFKAQQIPVPWDTPETYEFNKLCAFPPEMNKPMASLLICFSTSATGVLQPQTGYQPIVIPTDPQHIYGNLIWLQNWQNWFTELKSLRASLPLGKWPSCVSNLKAIWIRCYFA